MNIKGWEVITDDCGCCWSIVQGKRYLAGGVEATEDEMRLMCSAPMMHEYLAYLVDTVLDPERHHHEITQIEEILRRK